MSGRLAKRGRRSALAALCAITIGSSAPAFAAGAQQPSVLAREAFNEGKAAAEVGRFSEAAGHFRRSLELVPKPSAAFNLAVALRGMGRPKEARDVLDRLIERKYGAPPPAMLPAARRLRREVAASVSKIVVSLLGVKRAELRVDGERHTYSGRSLTLEVNPGEHVVSASAKAYIPAERKLIVAAGSRKHVTLRLELSPEARMATLEVVAKEPDARVEIVGIGWGRGRVARRVEPGSYELRLRSDAGDRDSTVTVRPGTSYRVELVPEGGFRFAGPWPWIAASVVVTGAVIGGYFLLRDPNKEPVRDPHYQTIETLVRF